MFVTALMRNYPSQVDLLTFPVKRLYRRHLPIRLLALKYQKLCTNAKETMFSPEVMILTLHQDPDIMDRDAP